MSDSAALTEIGFREIRKNFGALCLFEGISFVCPAGKYMCMLGPSGCGKTTLIKMVAGLTDPDSGDILVGSVRVNDMPPQTRGVGYAFQNYALYPHLTVAENLAFPLKAPMRRRQFAAGDIERRVAEVAAVFQIDGLLHRGVGQLSGGQQQRVALGRSIICNPQVLLLDEPVAHLDARLRYDMRAELKQLHRRIGTTTIHVTHDQQEALAIADVIAVIKDGLLQQLGEPLQLYHEPATAFVAGFVGDPPMSLLRAALVADQGRPALAVQGTTLSLPDELAAQAAAAPSRDVMVGFRPRHVALATGGGAGAMAATIYTHEIIGRQLQLMLAIGDDLLRYRTDQPMKVAVGDRMHVALTFEGARLFDATTGRALARG